MSLGQRLNVLNRIYRLYDDVSKHMDMACKKYCAACCTPHVTMTTLEGYLIADQVISNSQMDLFEKIQAKISKNRFKPNITTNRLADLCMKEDDMPEEEKKPSNKSCPVLIEDQCPFYEFRPFGCRCFISKHDCNKEGYAEVDPYDMTVNTLFMQFIEHIDAMWFSGNLADVLLLMASKKHRDNYAINALTHPGPDFISNHVIKVLMVPPEHRTKIKPVLEALLKIEES